ncbi:MAG: T9SS type A sorting domain-containing protein [Bacteroidetes bacterium]|nr:T9SS type A sorting domain-containing protein [Bacteroidota bacterium]
MNKFSLLIFFVVSAAALVNGQSPPAGFSATAYERHVELRWQPVAGSNILGYKIFRRTGDSGDFQFLKQVDNLNAALDWTGASQIGTTFQYKLKTVATNGTESDFSEPATATTYTMSDEQMLDMVQRATFRYFWDYAHPNAGLARERNNGDPNIVTTGGSGFGIMSIVVAAERGWITRDEAVNRMVQIVSFLQFADTYHGAFPHWINGNTGNVVPFSQYDNGADLVETAFLMQGLLAARQYFNQDTPLEDAVRSVITGLWEDVEWDWFRRNNSPVLYWHWSPNYGWQMNFQLRGFFEAQIVYILAAASPTHPVPGSLYQTGWTSVNYANGAVHFGYPIYCGPFGGGPMFFAHYSYLGFDPRGIRDSYCNYFVRNRNHALIQYNYAIANPENHEGYSADCWGLTSCDQQNGYAAHDIVAANDNGTVAPTAALASMPYTPEESLRAMRWFYREQGEKLWGLYGFYDAFNLDQNWYASSYLAIDQGPIVGMIENYRTGLLWNLFMQNPEIQPALDAIGFVEDATATHELNLKNKGFDVAAWPNPAGTSTNLSIEIALNRPQTLNAWLWSADGQRIRPVFDRKKVSGSAWQDSLPLEGLAPGIYLLSVSNEQNESVTLKIVVQKD